MSFAAFFRTFGIYFTKHHRGKMSGMWSLNTSCACNPHCVKQQGCKGSVCEACYVPDIMKQFPKGAKRWEENTKSLNENIIPVEAWPYIKKDIFRLESFGDLQSVLQAIHYINFATANPQTTFALWTKHPHYLKRAFDAGYKKPENLIIIFSSFWLNKASVPPYDFINKIFTAYDREIAEQNEIDINCGARNCNTCRRCYSKNGNGVEYINEIKKDKKKQKAKIEIPLEPKLQGNF